MAMQAGEIQVCLTAIFRPKKGDWKDVEAALIKAVKEVNKEKGCIRYEMTESGAERLVLTEIWASQEDLDGHNLGQPLKLLNEELQDRLTTPVELIFTS